MPMGTTINDNKCMKHEYGIPKLARTDLLINKVVFPMLRRRQLTLFSLFIISRTREFGTPW